MVAAEASERVREQVDPRRGGRSDVDRPRLEPGERVQLLLAGREGRERLARVRREDAAGFRQAAAAAVSLDQPLPGRGLEQTEVGAGARLPDTDRARRPRDAPLPLELDEQPEPGRVPEEGERAIGGADGRHCHFRLAR